MGYLDKGGIYVRKAGKYVPEIRKEVNQVIDAVSSFFKSPKKVEVQNTPTVKLVPKPSQANIAKKQHEARAAARIKANARGNTAAEHNMQLRQKWAEHKYGDEYVKKLEKDFGFTPQRAQQYANDLKLESLNKYIEGTGRTPVNLSRKAAIRINNRVANQMEQQYIAQQAIAENAAKTTADIAKEIQTIPKGRLQSFWEWTGSPKARPFITGLTGLGIGTLGYQISKMSADQPDTSEETPQEYMFDPDKGWQHYDPTSGQYVDQQEEFGVDRFGNTNFYDEDTGQWIGDYIQGADGSVYDRNGNLIGNVAPNLQPGQNIFDLNLQKVASILGKSNLTANDIKILQEKFGLTADGIVGARTMNAVLGAKADKEGKKPVYFTTYQNI